MPLLGPLFFHDLVRLARRSRGNLLRCLFALTLLAVLGLVYAQRFPNHDLFALTVSSGPSLPIPELARFAEAFAAACLTVQGAAVLLLTPAYLAGAIAEEKDRRSLDALLTTPLHDHEIVLGKLLGRLAHVAGVLLTGLPVLALTQVWGGVDLAVLLAAWVVTALTLLSVGSLSILCSVLARSQLTAVLSAYGVLLVWHLLASNLGCLCLPTSFGASPIGFMLELDWRGASQGWMGTGTASGLSAGDPIGTLMTMVTYYAVIHGMITLLCTGWAILQLRPFIHWPYHGFGSPQLPRLVLTQEIAAKPAEGESSAPRSEPPPAEKVVSPWVLGVSRTEDRLAALDPLRLVADSPLLWKELHHGTEATSASYMRPLALILVLYFQLLVPGTFLAVLLTQSKTLAVYRAAANPLIRLVSFLLMGVWCLNLAFRAAGTVSRERQQQTLDSLLTLPMSRDAILFAKWLGSALRLRSLGYCLAVFWMLGTMTGTLHPLAGLLLPLACALHLAFLTSMGIFLSVACRTTLWSHFLMAVVLLVVFLGPWCFLLYSPVPQAPDLTYLLLGKGLNPLHTWYFLGFSWDEHAIWTGDDGPFALTLVSTLAGMFLFATMAWGLWLAACWRFRRPRRKSSLAFPM
jgi:ABC-type transport system involved in multi-copper enzyme maturation permease subunit